ncbi:MAG TPA: sodium ion-translocating decarboxylase subunit beta [Epulopiscium sp.]|nr:sodium ion-translocating decarboxylase subunit beta [Candidatus Epulonipiscium sp.]
MEKRKSIKIVVIIMIAFMLITLVWMGFNLLIPPEAKSIGIIGGVDGPTSIFITSSLSLNVFTGIFGVILITGLVYLFFTKKPKK